jgi:hypothetical protein
MRRFLIAVVLVAACSALAPSVAAAAPPRWQTIPGDGHGFRGAWAVDRAWLFKDDIGAGADEMVIRSARIGAGRLGTWTTQRLPDATTYVRVIADKLLYIRPDGKFRWVALQADGSLGAPELPPGPYPDGAAPVQISAAVVQLPDRLVWIGGVPETFNTVRRFGCCTAGGTAVDYSSFLPPSVRTGGREALGRDASGRLWFAWIQGGIKGTVKAIELAADTLQPVGSPLTAPLPRSASLVGMPCEANCYLVTETARGRAYSWRPGAASATRVPMLNRSSRAPGMIEVDSFGGRMLFAYWADSTERGVRIRLARGNAHGANPRVLRTIFDPTNLGLNSHSGGPPLGIVGPRGAVVFQQYDNFVTGRVFLRAAFLRR